MCHDAGGLFGQCRIQSAQCRHPGFDIAALRSAHLSLRGRGQVREIAVLNPDQVRFVEGEVQVEVDQAGQGRSGVGCRRDDGLSAGEQAGAHTDQQFDQKGFFVREVAVDRGTADSCGGADVLEPDGEVAAFGDQFLRGRQQLLATAGLLRIGADGALPGRRWTYRVNLH